MCVAKLKYEKKKQGQLVASGTPSPRAGTPERDDLSAHPGPQSDSPLRKSRRRGGLVVKPQATKKADEATDYLEFCKEFDPNDHLKVRSYSDSIPSTVHGSILRWSAIDRWAARTKKTSS